MRRFKYPRMILFILSYIIAIIAVPYLRLPSLVVRLGYLGVFMLGFLYVYTSTTGIATLTLLAIAREQKLSLEGAIAGLGAFLGDLILSYLMKEGLNGEISRLTNERIAQVIESRLPAPIKGRKVTISLACFLIASPLPTEVGAALLGSIREVPMREMVLIMGLLHSVGIFLILILGAL
ncbi:MAG: hypothetical protein NZ992_06895 [Candidatus Korarchaeum sp.]|nr:hypothetical protein [Candidatus Korarchaeum sp.]MDW8035208.1 hypothetical protein [Candidatus Korarchaeum sp.]